MPQLCNSIMDLHARGHGIEFWSSQKFFNFLQLPCYSTSYTNYYTKCLRFPKIYNHISFYGPNASGASDTGSFICHVVITDCWKLNSMITEQIPVMPPTSNFIQICPAVLLLKHANSMFQLENSTSPMCIHFVHIVQRTQSKQCWLAGENFVVLLHIRTNEYVFMEM